MSQLNFPVGSDLAAPFAVPEADWRAIDDQVALVVNSRDHASEIETFIPSFGKLLELCDTWRSTTFPGILAEAASASLFAADASSVLGRLVHDVAGLAPADPVPNTVSFLIRTQFKALSDTAFTRAAAASELGPAITAFATANQAAYDSWTSAMKGGPTNPPVAILVLLGSINKWAKLGPQAGWIQPALADVGTTWTGIANGLQAIAGGTIEITTADLLSSNLSEAAESWSRLASDAAAFGSMAAKLS